tara:strand:- start:1688 stop:2488 length:801 start_codon:yes stop_codon:yes gene_type:complete
MKLYTSKHSAVVAMIQKQLLSPGTNITEISLQTNIGRQQIYRWLNGSATQIHDKSLYAVANAFNLKIIKTPEGIQIHHIKNEETNMTNQQTIEQKYIAVLEKTNEQLEKQIEEKKTSYDLLLNQNPSTKQWKAIAFDFSTDTVILRNGLKFGTKVKSVYKLDALSKKLNYPTDYLFEVLEVGVDKWFDDERKIFEILELKTIRAMKEEMDKFPMIISALKTLLGDHFFIMPLIYKDKDNNIVPAVTYNKVFWKDMKIESKIKFVID